MGTVGLVGTEGTVLGTVLLTVPLVGLVGTTTGVLLVGVTGTLSGIVGCFGATGPAFLLQSAFSHPKNPS